MNKEPDWGKHGVIATWVIGVTVIGLTILAYLRPPDPAHPISFDFLSRSINISLLSALSLLFISIVATIALTWRIVEVKYQAKALPPTVLAKEIDKTPPSTIKSAILPTTKASTGKNENGTQVEPLMADGRMELFPSPSDQNVTFKITRDETIATKGLLICIMNYRLSAIGRNVIAISSARSFDSRLNAYREGELFTPFTSISNGPIHASRTGPKLWLIRKDHNSDSLFAGNDTLHELHWPDNDTSEVHQWKLNVRIHTWTATNNPYESPTELIPMNLHLIIKWNSTNRQFFIGLRLSADDI
jgi:hypothetical protein